MARRLLASLVALSTGLGALALAPGAGAEQRVPTGGRYNVKTSSATGYGGAVTSVDPEASRVGLEVLRKGGNAVDAAVATAAALGVTEPYSSGIGGGGYFVHYDARTGRVSTLDGRETAPATMPADAFVDPATGEPYRFTPELVTSGVAVGTPGTLATWDAALRRWGTRSLARSLRPATRLATRGFVVDQTFRDQTADNAARFRQFPATTRQFLPGNRLPRVGSVMRNRDLAATYRLISRRGAKAFYTGPLARQIARTVQDPPTVRRPSLPVPPGYVTTRDLAGYRVAAQEPTRVVLPGLRRLRHGPVLAAAARPSARRSTSWSVTTWVGCPRSTRSTSTSRRARWRSPTGASTSATRGSPTCPWPTCCPTPSPPSATASSTPSARPQPSPSTPATSTTTTGSAATGPRSDAPSRTPRTCPRPT